MMTWPFPRTDTKQDQASTTLDPFIANALSEIEEKIQGDQQRSRTLSECYIYGAIRYLASYDNMLATDVTDLMETMLIRHFNADTQEANNSLSQLSDTKADTQEQLFMIEGASALRRWLVNGDRTVASDLRVMLNDNESSSKSQKFGSAP